MDSPAKDIRAHWPEDAVAIELADEEPGTGNKARYVLADDEDMFARRVTTNGERAVRLLGPYDPYLQLRDRELLVPDDDRRKDLWRTLGRPGAIVADGEVLGTWRPRSAGKKLTVRLDLWDTTTRADRRRIDSEAERLAAFRGVTLAGIAED